MDLYLLIIPAYLSIGTIGNVDWSGFPPVGNPLEADALRIGACLSGDTWLKCSGGCNNMKIGGSCDDHIGLGGSKCVIGEPAGFEIYCTYTYKLLRTQL